ncbi:MAG: thioredoxin [Weeksellaceae bacterium]|nr:thioredoxin [Weeksellaceae bacterium]
MKKFISTLAVASSVLLSVNSCKAQTKVVLNREVDTEKDGKMLLGQQSTDQFRKAPYSEWFVKENTEYSMDRKTVDELKKEKLNTFDIMVFVGTWCEDSHREFPRLMKILEAAEFPSERLTIIGVDRKKEDPDSLHKKYSITKVPTIIVSRKGTELGRIVENPVSGYLERDLLKIIKKHDPSVKDIFK